MKDFKGREIESEKCNFPVNEMYLEGVLDPFRTKEDGYTLSVIEMIRAINEWFDGDRKNSLSVLCISSEQAEEGGEENE